MYFFLQKFSLIFFSIDIQKNQIYLPKLELVQKPEQRLKYDQRHFFFFSVSK